tara:strand:+ start:162 stop:545 length:384 start_codon:yes stop_codon:yes gene_type:complete
MQETTTEPTEAMTHKYNPMPIEAKGVSAVKEPTSIMSIMLIRELKQEQINAITYMYLLGLRFGCTKSPVTSITNPKIRTTLPSPVSVPFTFIKPPRAFAHGSKHPIVIKPPQILNPIEIFDRSIERT